MKISFAFILPAIAGFAQFAQGTTLFQLDFDNSVPASPDNTQSGWQTFSETADANNKTVNYSGFTGLALGNISITTAGVTNTRNYNNGGAAAPDFPGTGLDRLYNDMILNNGAVNTSITITIAGLMAGTYDITTHHLTEGGSGSTKSTFDFHVQDADSPTFGQNVGTFEMGRGASSPLFFAPTVLNFAVTSNGTDPVLLRIRTASLAAGGGQGAWVGISGMEIQAIPEPSAALLGAIGFLALLRRRR